MENNNKEEIQNEFNKEDLQLENTEESISDNQGKETSKKLTVDKIEFDNLNDKYLRLGADFENLKRRTSKEIAETISVANSRLMLNIIPIIDDFERYFVSKQDPDEGITLIYNKLKSSLEKSGLKQIEVNIDDTFDPETCEAISQIKSKPDSKGKIVDIIEKGYKLNDNIIKFVKVIIGE